MGRLDDVDLTQSLGTKEYERLLSARSWRLAQLRLALGGKLGDRAASGPGLLVLFEGWDAAGKGGAIKRLVAPLDARHVRVVQYAAPTRRREAPLLPAAASSSSCRATAAWPCFDRTWYGRVLVERVEGFATDGAVAARVRARSSTSSARSFLEGMIVVKFWLHISKDEQLRRFKRARRIR